MLMWLTCWFIVVPFVMPIFQSKPFTQPEENLPNGQIAFVFEGKAIFLMNADGTNLTKIVEGLNFEWSHDGTQIAVTAFDGHDTEIYLVDVETLKTQPLTSNEINDVSPHWSPDDQFIGFLAREDLRQNVFRINLQSMEIEQLTQLNSASADFNWSPDGNSIVYSDCFQTCTAYLMNSDGTEQHQVDINPAGEIIWSPDSQQLAFVTVDGFGEDRTVDLTIIDLATMQAKILFSLKSESISSLEWSPDGRYIAFGVAQNIFVENASNAQTNNIYMIHITDKSIQNISQNEDTAHHYYWASWSLDSRFIAYASIDEGIGMCQGIATTPV